ASGANSYYQWDFEVGTFIDLVPPRVESVYPSPSNIEPRNVVVQINFNEAVDPTTVSVASNVDESGQVTFDKIQVLQVTDSATTPVVGSFSIANQYRTVEFTTTDLCGENSCGEDVYCLPANANLKVVVKAAQLEPASEPDVPAGPTAKWLADIGYDGVVDMAANSLNGNGENGAQCSVAAGQTGLNCFGQAELNANHCDCAIGPTADNYFWNFVTNNTIDITAPIVETASPAVASFVAVDVNDPTVVLFNKVLMARSLVGGESVILASDGNVVTIDGKNYPENLPYWPGMENIDRDGDGYRDDQSRVTTNHDPYQRAATGQTRFDYASYYTAGIRDVYQNCYFPSGAGSDVAGGCLPGDPSPSCCNDTVWPDASDPAYDPQFGSACPRPLWPEWP
ncbi:MAG: Ig-like domain-containing protein, partial [Patescibacteria group bacterium]